MEKHCSTWAVFNVLQGESCLTQDPVMLENGLWIFKVPRFIVPENQSLALILRQNVLFIRFAIDFLKKS